MKKGRILAGLAAGAIVIAGFGAGGAPAKAQTETNTLYAGQTLVAGTDFSELITHSPTDIFTLDVVSEYAIIDETAVLKGSHGPDSTSTNLMVFEDGQESSNTDATSLTMQTDGNLVLRSGHGRVIWATYTRGSGTQNRLVIQSDGNLVMRTSTNKVVWATYTTPVLLAAGKSLQSGQSMIDRWEQRWGQCPDALTMQGDGNLVLRCGNTVRWASYTGVSGSHLDMQTDGNLVIRSPSGAALWTSKTPGHGSYTWLNEPGMYLSCSCGNNVVTYWTLSP